MREISVADYFVEFLIANGVTEVFGYQGGMIAYIFDSLGKYKDKINYYSCATEQGAALAACGYSQATGKLGVAISTSGPGFTNLLTGVANAWFDSVPVLYVSGNVNTKDKKRDKPLRQLGFQEIQAANMAKEITKKSVEIELGMDYIKCFDDALLEAMSERKGPVYLDLPINVCRETVMLDKAISVKLSNPKSIDISDIVNALCNSKKPLIIAGAGIKQAGCVKEFRKLIDTLNIPVATTLPAIDVLTSESPFMMGYIGGTARREAGIALQNADYVLSIGTRLCSKQLGHNLDLFAPNATVFHRVDIDENELCRRLKDNEKDIVGDIRFIIPALIEMVENKGYSEKWKIWSDACHEMHSELSTCDITEGNMICRTLSEVIPESANILLDVGKNLTYGGQSSIVKENTEMFMSAGLGTMGYAIPAAMGAYLGNKKPTYVITGDGGAQMNIQELNTIVKNHLPIKIIVLNNKALGNIRIFQEQYLDSRFVATSEKEGDYFSCDFVKIAKAYGIEASASIGCRKDADLENAIHSSGAYLQEIIYNDCPALPGIVAGGAFLDTETGIESNLAKKIKDIMGV